MKNCIALISGSPLNLAPYLLFYINILKENNVDFIILNVENSNNDIIYENQILFNVSYKPGFINKLISQIKGIKYLIHNIKKYKCNRIIVVPTRTGIRLLPYLYIYFNEIYILI